MGYMVDEVKDIGCIDSMISNGEARHKKNCIFAF